MKITGVRTRTVVVPLKRKVVSRIGAWDRMWFVLVDLDEAEASTGAVLHALTTEEPVLAFRDGVVLAARLARSELPSERLCTRCRQAVR